MGESCTTQREEKHVKSHRWMGSNGLRNNGCGWPALNRVRRRQQLIYINQSNKPPSSPFRKGERGGLCIVRIMKMHMLFVDAALRCRYPR
jgi:hypothetical protein